MSTSFYSSNPYPALAHEPPIPTTHQNLGPPMAPRAQYTSSYTAADLLEAILKPRPSTTTQLQDRSKPSIVAPTPMFGWKRGESLYSWSEEDTTDDSGSDDHVEAEHSSPRSEARRTVREESQEGTFYPVDAFFWDYPGFCVCNECLGIQLLLSLPLATRPAPTSAPKPRWGSSQTEDELMERYLSRSLLACLDC